MKIILTTSILALSACAAVELADADFRPGNDMETFEYRVTASSLFPMNDHASEQKRIDAIDDRVAQSSMCANGYDITSRRVINIGNPGGADADLFYFGRCR